jgi:hypothetical protein
MNRDKKGKVILAFQLGISDFLLKVKEVILTN